MNQIPTAEEFLSKGLEESGFEFEGQMKNIAVRKMKQYAALVKNAALQAAADNANLLHTDNDTGSTEELVEYNGYEGYNEDPITVTVNKQSILNAYPDERIK